MRVKIDTQQLGVLITPSRLPPARLTPVDFESTLLPSPFEAPYLRYSTSRTCNASLASFKAHGQLLPTAVSCLHTAGIFQDPCHLCHTKRRT